MEQETIIEMVDVQELQLSDFNPPSRSESKNIRDLVKSMNKSGFWKYSPILIANGIVADGHRRIAAAKICNITKIPAIKIEGDHQKVWVEMNSIKRAIYGKDWISAVSNGLSADIAMTTNKCRVGNIISVGGVDLLKYFNDNGLTSYTMELARHVAKYIGLETDNAVLIQIVHWMKETKSTNAVKMAMKEQIDPRILLEIILGNEPLRMTWSGRS